MTGVARASMTRTESSPTTTPEFGSPSAVSAYTPGASSAKVSRLSARSAWLANALLISVLLRNAGRQHDRPALAEADRDGPLTPRAGAQDDLVAILEEA